MRAIVMLMLAGACAAHAQVNRGFEQGDFTGFSPLVTSPDLSSIVTETDDGLSPIVASRCARLRAGTRTQAEAEQLMDLAPGRLAQVYQDLGGVGAADGGDYNVLRVDPPNGDYYFWWHYVHGDADDAGFLDHAFVVNGRGEITMLADSLSGDGGPNWHSLGVPHPGGAFYFVVANGADQSVDPVLFIDDTQNFDPSNPSFQSGLAKWSIEDAGANHSLAVSQTFAGKPPTDGNLMAQLTAGEMSQSDANQFLKLNPDALADLYADIGGQGDAIGGDYSIIWQEMPVGDVTFDWVVEQGDVHELDFPDHAFVVNGAGEITVLYNSLNGPVVDWQTQTIPHPGGRLFVVVANGGDDGKDPILYLDNFRRGTRALDTALTWDASTTTPVQWGDSQIETFGQTFVAEGTSLESMTLFVEDVQGLPIEFEAYVYAWNGQHATGEAIFASGPLTTDGLDLGVEPVVVPTPGARLVEGETYVAFLTVSNTLPTGKGARLGFTDADEIAGHFVYSDNNANFNKLLSIGWNTIFSDLACRFEFGEAGKASAPTIYDNVYAGVGNSWPWNAGTAFRYQQLYRADQLDGPGIVDKFSYRVSPQVGQKFADKQIACQIWLGHSNREPLEMSTAFDDNFTSDKTMVVDGAVTLSSAGHNGFDIEVNVADAFEYNGVDNLLMEIVIPDASNSGVGAFDSGTAQASGVGAGPSTTMNRLSAFGANAQTGSLDKWDGLATRFEFLPPEVPCPADCDDNGQLNILDFVCFQFNFQEGAGTADCNADGVLNILDFVCFQQALQDGCS